MGMVSKKGKTGWVRLHCLPRACRGIDHDDMSVQQMYIYLHSYTRYLDTEDGAYLQGALKEALQSGEIGSIESVWFIEPEELVEEIVVDEYVPDYTRNCDCGATPVVTGVKDGVVIYRGAMCGCCTWGEADCLDPANW
jgi:hypothetical protein